MDHSQVIKYFDEYIKKYSPYQDNETYVALMEYISQNFTKELYETIPSQFKQLYEDNYIDNNTYDILLKNIGVPDKILNKLSINEKIILFKNFTDFYRYRGDVYFFDKVSKLFEYTVFDVYELYIDYDDSINDWVFKPYELIKNSDIPTLNLNIRYDEIYDNIPSFLITKQQLTSYKNNKEIILPLKSNIVLLDYTFMYKLNEMINLINATFLKEYKTHDIVCYFIDNEFTFTLKKFFIIWYYILLRAYDSSIGDVPIQWIIEYTNSNNLYTLDNVDRLLEEYNSVSTAQQSREFYEKYISKIFKTYTYSNPHESIDLEYMISSEFIEYVDSRVSDAMMDDKQVYNVILDELLNSFILNIGASIDEHYVKYSEYFINSLTRITMDPKDTSSYLLLHNYKPFHTELLTAYNDIIFSNSNFDLVTPDDTKIRFLYDLQTADTFNCLDYYITNFICNSFDSLHFDENSFSTFLLSIQTNIEIMTESMFFDSKFNVTNIYNQVDFEKFDIKLTQLFQLLPIEYSVCNSVQSSFNEMTTIDDTGSEQFIINYLTKINLTHILLDYTVNKISSLHYSHNLISDGSNEIYTKSSKELTAIIESNLFKLLVNLIENSNFSDFQLSDIKIHLVNMLQIYDHFICSYIVGVSENVNLSDTYDKLTYLKHVITTLLTTEFFNVVSNLFILSVNTLLDSSTYTYQKIEKDSECIIRDNFNFSNSTNTIVVFNLYKYVGMGLGGLNVGDKVKRVDDDDIHYRTILDFDDTLTYIKLDSNYTGTSGVGQLTKQSSMSEKHICRINYDRSLTNNIFDYSSHDYTHVNVMFNNLIEDLNFQSLHNYDTNYNLTDLTYPNITHIRSLTNNIFDYFSNSIFNCNQNSTYQLTEHYNVIY